MMILKQRVAKIFGSQSEWLSRWLGRDGNGGDGDCRSPEARSAAKLPQEPGTGRSSREQAMRVRAGTQTAL